VSTIGPVAVGVVLAFAWNMTLSQPQGVAESDLGVTPKIGLTVEQAAAQAWASATPRTATTVTGGTAAAGTAATRTTAAGTVTVQAAAGGSAGTPGSGTWWAHHPRHPNRHPTRSGGSA
jgi:hypothetical protein